MRYESWTTCKWQEKKTTGGRNVFKWVIVACGYLGEPFATHDLRERAESVSERAHRTAPTAAHSERAIGATNRRGAVQEDIPTPARDPAREAMTWSADFFHLHVSAAVSTRSSRAFVLAAPDSVRGAPRPPGQPRTRKNSYFGSGGNRRQTIPPSCARYRFISSGNYPGSGRSRFARPSPGCPAGRQWCCG